MDFQEMLQIAREEGRQEGILEGREEGRKQIIREFLPKCLEAGLPNEDICRIFKLTEEELSEMMNTAPEIDESFSS